MKAKLETDNINFLIVGYKDERGTIMFVPKKSNVTLRDLAVFGNAEVLKVADEGVWLGGDKNVGN